MAAENHSGDLIAQVEALAEKAKAQRAAQGKTLPKARKDASPTPQLPFWPDETRANPNAFARSALFAPVAKGRRKSLWKSVLASREDVIITYSGQQLDEADRDVWLHILHVARMKPLGAEFEMTRRELLRALGRDVGKSQYVWLKGVVERLFSATMFIETTGYTIGPDSRGTGLRLLGSFEFHGGRDAYHFSIDRRTMALFQREAYGLVEWRQRLMLQQDLAKWLHCLIVSNAPGVQRYALEDLRTWIGAADRARRFRARLEDAMRELEQIGLIRQACFGRGVRGREQVVWTRCGTAIASTA